MIEGMLSDYIIRESSWKKKDGHGAEHAQAILSRIIMRNPHLLAGILHNIGDKNKAIKAMKVEVESDVCKQNPMSF